MNKLGSETRASVINCLIEGCSIRATVRMTSVAKKTVKVHSSLRVSPAMAANVSDRLWDVEDLVTLWESYERAEELVA
jgi:hypothetical protein